MGASEISASVLTARLARVGGRVALRYVEDARAEAASDLRRLLMGGVVLALAMCFLLHMVAFAHGAALAGLVTLGIPLLYVLGGIAVLDLMVCLLALATGQLLITRPLLVRTRASLSQLTDLLTSDDL